MLSGPKFKYCCFICLEGLNENRRRILIRVSDLNQGCVEYEGMSPTGRFHAVPRLKSVRRRILLKLIVIGKRIGFSWFGNCSWTVNFEYGNGISGSVTSGGGLLMF